jgi:type II secretory pathway pseudopilin PulG
VVARPSIQPESVARRGRGASLGRNRAGLRRVAFTLTDCLVLVAVLSLLGAILAARAVAVKDKTRLAACTANLGKVNRAVLTFSTDNNQTFPARLPNDNRNLWWWYKEQVKRYAGLQGESSPNDTLFACPEDRGYSDPVPFRRNARFDFTSYVFNGVTLPGMPNIAGLPLAAVKRPNRTLLVMEWTAHAPLSWHKSKTGRKNSPFYCDAQSVTGFVGGHVGFTRIYYDGYNAAYTQDPIAGYEYQYSGN